MEYNSFYGGRRGASFIISKSYKSIEEMITSFKLGGSYKTVNYDEYVLIDTIKKNDKDNGKVYRRGYEYNNNMGGAIYVGQIVGPSGMAPHLELTTIEEVNSLADEEGFEYRRGEGSYSSTKNLIPGKESQNGIEVFNDEIQWSYCSVRDKNANDTTAYIGFKIPYTVIDIAAESVSAYTDGELSERVDNKEHPFYEKWKVKIPKGIKGNAFQNLKVVNANNIIEDYKGQVDDIENNRRVLVYDYYNYDNNESGDPVTIFLGDYNMISGVTMQTDGTLIFSYTHDDDQVFSKFFKWIKQISINGETGHFAVEYNQETDRDDNPTKYETDLRWVNNIVIAEDGSITLKYTTGADVVLNNKIKWVTKTEILTGDIEGDGSQKIKVTYNDGSSEEIGQPLNYIIRTAVSDDYHLLFLHSDPAKRAEIIEARENYTYDGRDDWQDMGSIKDHDGILIGLNFSSDEYPELLDITAAIEYLNTNYPNGLIDPDVAGKIVSIQRTEDNTSLLFAFDYGYKTAESGEKQYKGWYLLGDVSVSGVTSIAGSEADETTQTLAATLPTNGLWFIIE